MAKILVTGGSGFIGSNLVAELLKDPKNEVIVFDSIPYTQAKNLAEFSNGPNFRFVSGDITNKKILKKVFSENLDYVYHLAAVVGIKHYLYSPLKLIDVNVIGTKNVLELSLKSNTKVVFSSTSEIYGKNPKIPWKETDDRVLGSTSIDRWNYSTSKALGEHMLYAMHRTMGLPMTIVRYFNVYGPKQQPHFVVSQSIYKVINGERPLLYDTGQQTRCFTFVEDAVQGTILAATKTNGEVFNIGSNKETSIRELITQIIKIAGKEDDISPEIFDTKKNYGSLYEDIHKRVPDVKKAKKLLGWEATTSLEVGLRKTIEWAKVNYVREKK
ncbi:MAG: GDP-mannose 4,6-dehydratase [Candidatus Woesearchaeota archaeon]